MVFGKGRIPNCEFRIQTQIVERVKFFVYLGISLSVQLSYSSQASLCNAKARKRIAYLFYKLPLLDIPFALLVKVFECYILPIYTYCVPIWIHGLTKNEIEAINAVWACFLKRYLGLPKASCSAGLLYYCDTMPLYNILCKIAQHTFTNINFPSDSMAGHQLSFANVRPLPPYDPLPILPEEFPREIPFMSAKKNNRFETFRNIFNVGHYKVCSLQAFHFLLTSSCSCLYCKATPLLRGHQCGT